LQQLLLNKSNGKWVLQTTQSGLGQQKEHCFLAHHLLTERYSRGCGRNEALKEKQKNKEMFILKSFSFYLCFYLFQERELYEN
jgi:hypothetical protein